mmetsp:Transcript_75136/g.125265  ORF Transcript_75136/g.125265 Transcript_75136/m.125265 type:complete len:636 (+) Transcript_75136:2-1909(+)
MIDSLSTMDCTDPTGLADPLVASGGAFRPLSFERWLPVGPSGHELLALSNATVFWIQSRPTFQVRHFFSTSDAHFVGAWLNDNGSLLLVDSPRRRKPRWLEVAPDAALLRDVVMEGLQQAAHAVSYGECVYVLAADHPSIGVFDARSLSLRRKLELPAAAHSLAIGPTVMFVLLQSGSPAGSTSAPSSLDQSSGDARCDVLVLERHSRRSTQLWRGVANTCGPLAAHGGDLLLLDRANAEVRRIPASRLTQQAGHKLAVLSPTASVLWRCEQPCYPTGLAIAHGFVYVSLAPGSTGRPGASVIEIDLIGNTSTAEQQELPHPPTLLLSPSYLARAEYKPMPLYEKLLRRKQGRWRGSANNHRELSELRTTPRMARVRSPQPFSMLGAVDIEALRAAVLSRWDVVWEKARDSSGVKHDYNFLFPGLQGITNTFPGLQNAKLLFSGAHVGYHGVSPGLLSKMSTSSSHASCETCLLFPLWRKLAPQVLPLLDEVLYNRLGMRNLSRFVWRVQLNRMPKGAAIKPHVDQGNYASLSHRVHIPLIVPRCVRFEQLKNAHSPEEGWREIPMKESEAFEVNNKIKHQVIQSGPYERITLIIDVAEQPCERYVEISEGCRGWNDPNCVTDFDVNPDEWRGAF